VQLHYSTVSSLCSPHCFARLPASADALLQQFSSVPHAGHDESHIEVRARGRALTCLTEHN
jgi:hypothetical protein